MSLYIRQTLNRYAPLNVDGAEKEGWEIFDALETPLSKMAAKFDLFIDRESVDECQSVMVIHASRPNSHCFYSGECFEYDMSVQDDPSFEERSNAFIQLMMADEDFKELRGLEFNEPGERYFVSS